MTISADYHRKPTPLNNSLFLNAITNPQVSFAVKQKTPKGLDEAVTAVIQIESYLTPAATKPLEAPGTAGNDTQQDIATFFVGRLPCSYSRCDVCVFS